jgi:O-antigen/teichoic acid export membrane protein
VKRRHSYREGLGFGALSAATLIVLGVGSSIAIARAYGIEEIGRYALALAPSFVLTYLSTAQEQAALVRKLALLEPRDPSVTGLFAAVLGFSTALTLLVAGLTVGATALLFHGPIDHPDLVAPAAALLASQALITNPCWNLDMVFASYRAGRDMFWIRLHQALAFLVLAMLGGVLWGTVWGLVLATAGSWALALAHRVLVVRGYMRLRVPAHELRAGLRELPGMVRFGIRLAPAGIANGLASQIGIWVLGAAGTLAAVGAYQRAWQLGSRILDVNYRITETLFPTLVERRAAGDAQGFDRALVDTMRYAGVGMLLPAAAGGGAGYGVMELFGSGFARAGDTLAVLLVVPALAAVAGVQGQALIANDRPFTTTKVAFGRMALTLALTAALVAPLGMIGAAIGWAGGYLASIVLLQRLTRRHLSCRLRELWPARQLLALALAFAAGFLSARAIDAAIDSLAGLPLALVVGTGAYLGVFVAAGGLARRDRRRAADLLGRLRPLRGAAAS